MAVVRAIAVLLLVVGALLNPAHSQNTDAPYPRLQTHVDPTSGTIGDRFRLTITAQAPDLESLEMLSFFDAQTTWSLVSDPQVNDVTRNGARHREYVFDMVPFETGRVYIPEVAVTYNPDAGTSNTAFSQRVWVQVNSVLSGDGSASALRDVKPPVSLPVPKAIVVSGSIFLFLLIAVLVWWLWRRYSQRVQRMFGRNLTPPEAALKQLAELEDHGLIEQKRYRELYTRIVDVLRGYLHDAYGVHAEDLTSNELLDEMDRLADGESPVHVDDYRRAIARLVEVLNEADMVKFARYIPSPAHCRRSIQAAKDVVLYTRYRFVTDENAEQQPAAGSGPVDTMSPGTGVGSA